jgi:hypothetical protein
VRRHLIAVQAYTPFGNGPQPGSPAVATWLLLVQRPAALPAAVAVVETRWVCLLDPCEMRAHGHMHVVQVHTLCSQVAVPAPNASGPCSGTNQPIGQHAMA